ncbi:MAG: hypothetical protein IIY84_02275 [Eubacterium sp.]|nr:hypothetical protein [Eubacterium sp.]
MKRTRKINIRLTAIALILCLFAGLLAGCSGGKSDDYGAVIKGIDSYYHKLGNLDDDESITYAPYFRAGDAISDWLIIATARAGIDTPDYETYLKDLESYVNKAYADRGSLNEYMATEWHRAILAALVSGGDPRAFGTGRDGKPIDLVDEGIFHWDVTGGIDEQGSNGAIHALVTLDAGGWEDPADAVYGRPELIRRILNYAGADGSIGLVGKGGDVDLTAMALYALSPYREDETVYTLDDGTEMTVPEEIEKGLAYLQEAMSQGGYYLYGSAFSADSDAQVILALCALGIDPTADERFQKAGGNPVTALMSFRGEDGGFATALDREGKPEESNVLATRQAEMALTALLLLQRNGNGNVFDFSNRLNG